MIKFHNCLKTTFIFVSLIFVVGCISSGKSTATQKKVPDYGLDKSDFVKGDFNVLASEFCDEYSGKYIVVDGYYQRHGQGGQVSKDMYTYFLQNMYQITITNVNYIKNPSEATKMKTINILLPDSDKSILRKFISSNIGDKIKIFFYVVPKASKVTTRSNDGVYNFDYDKPVLWFIDAELNNE